MVKSSEVLRLAAKKALISKYRAPVISSAIEQLARYRCFLSAVYEYADMCGYAKTETQEETCMALCLAAVIAEDEGD